jgi:hypothetical protein
MKDDRLKCCEPIGDSSGWYVTKRGTYPKFMKGDLIMTYANELGEVVSQDSDDNVTVIWGVIKVTDVKQFILNHYKEDNVVKEKLTMNKIRAILFIAAILIYYIGSWIYLIINWSIATWFAIGMTLFLVIAFFATEITRDE